MAVAEPPQALIANLGWLLSQASHALTLQLTAALEGLGLGPRGYCVLATALGGGLTQTDIAQAVGLDKTTMVVTIDDLEAKGLVKRLPSGEDRRARIIAVTKTGERKIARAERIVEAVHAEILSEIPARQRDALLDALQRLACGRLAGTTQCSQPVRRVRSK
jgi:MarR family transcriptional regulator, transcriptional regulator for hemolysin